MKIKEIREFSSPELDKKLRDVGQELVNLRLRKQAGQVENSSLLKSLRRDLARMNTIRAEKEPSSTS
jgi:large subunit ribosomal protein L29